jgi:hypothetical protein
MSMAAIALVLLVIPCCVDPRAALVGHPSSLIAAGTGEICSPLAGAANEGRMARVVVSLKGLGAGPDWADGIAQARDRIMSALRGQAVEVTRIYDLIPALGLSVDAAALRILCAHPDVDSVAEDGTSTTGRATSSD